MSKQRTKSGETAHDGRSKIERYGWADAGQPGQLRQVSKHALVVNHAYQRELRESTVATVSQSFSWAAFGALIVFESPEGLAIVDGQNRHAAAMRRADVDLLPCVVFPSRGAAEEARAFLAINGTRRTVSAMDKHRATLLAGDPVTAEVDALVRAAGMTVCDGPGPNYFRAVALLTRLVASSATAPAVRRVWPTLCAARENTPSGTISERVLDGLVHIEGRLPEGVSLADARWTARIVSIGLDELHLAAVRAAALYAKGGARVWAVGIVDRINKGLKARLALKGSETEGAE